MRDEIRIAPRLLRTAGFAAEAIYVAAPSTPLKTEICRSENRAIRQGNGFRVEDLETFLSPLRAAVQGRT
jgi:hypothetical protein